MNRIFFALIAIAFVTGAGQQLAYDTGFWLPDADKDGLSDERERTLGTNPEDRDSDDDGLSDRDEIETHKTDPLAPDSDKDGVRDGVEVAHHSDPLAASEVPPADGLTEAERAPTAKSNPPSGPFVPPMEAVTTKLFDSVKAAVLTVVFPVIGAMAFFLGVMKVAEKGGAMLVLAKVLRPLMIRLFPEVPPNHPAMSAMIMNMAANALGLGNAATPFGLRAMVELDKLNPEKGTATNAMALFLAINTSSITLLATGVMNYRAGLGSADPAGVIPTTLFATACSTVAALVSCKLLERVWPSPAGAVSAEVLAEESGEDIGGYPIWVFFTALVVIGVGASLAVVYGDAFGRWIVPLIVTGFVGYGWWRGVAVYDAFIEGAKEGFEIAVRIIPYLAAILGVVGMLRGSGAIDLFTSLVGPLTDPLGLPAEALPMVLLRPLSGSGASGVMMEIMTTNGPDSYVGYLVSTMQGSSETTFYVLAVYFGSVGITKIRHAMIPGLLADLAGAIGSVIVVSAYFSYNGL